jgi:hypothetical protein
MTQKPHFSAQKHHFLIKNHHFSIKKPPEYDDLLLTDAAFSIGIRFVSHALFEDFGKNEACRSVKK